VREGVKVMRCFLCGAVVIVGVIGGGFVPARAAALPLAGLSGQKADAGLIKEAGWRRKLRRYGYPVPYYPPVYGYYVPPPPGAYAVPPAPPVEAYPSAEADYGDYPTANGEYGDYPPGDGY
jgi:hypothetical protein